ncbi:hypothetical protein AAFF_G00419980 [Aldrovandia affinis]|uniref:Uncharacterized protein n=1 Tax=Aldrovandia affinis TaxID=143900 RepID=A0AAD7WJ08_9TELE|nr:hypothetical protein AAFF_G00419980 [Aldrovandia affinis]
MPCFCPAPLLSISACRKRARLNELDPCYHGVKQRAEKETGPRPQWDVAPPHNPMRTWDRQGCLMRYNVAVTLPQCGV